MRTVMAVCACVLVATGPRASARQEAAPTADTPKATVSISDTTAPPEWELRVPVSLTMAQGTDGGRLTMRVTYPAKMLTYVKAQATDTLKTAGFDVKAEAAKPEGEAGSIAIELMPAGSQAKKLPSGVVAILVFKVDSDAEEGKQGSLAAEDVKAWGPRPASPELKAASDRTAMFIVAPPGLPIYNCFLYMH